MDEPSAPIRSDDAGESDVRDELRTIGFRLREIQRLLGMRVQQENRRLEADGLEPVTETSFPGHGPGREETTEDSSR